MQSIAFQSAYLLLQFPENQTMDNRAVIPNLTESYSIESLLKGEIIPFYKPLGWTSFDVVNKLKWFVKRNFKISNLKIGHAGTLDPLAEGLLIICTGKLTKAIESIQNQPKEYIATIGLGMTTPSYDLETKFDNVFPTEHITREQVELVLEKLRGVVFQTPPLFSAKRINGKRAYDIARAGKNKTLDAVEIHIYENELLHFGQNELKLRIACSKGTYIRSIANDIGIALHSGAYLKKLVRTKIGDYNAQNAHNPNEFCNALLTRTEVN